MENEELMWALITFGRNNLQDFVARSRDLGDAATYLLAELNYELARVTLFKTEDLVSFQKREFSTTSPIKLQAMAISIAKNLRHSKS